MFSCSHRQHTQELKVQLCEALQQRRRTRFGNLVEQCIGTRCSTGMVYVMETTYRRECIKPVDVMRSQQ